MAESDDDETGPVTSPDDEPVTSPDSEQDGGLPSNVIPFGAPSTPSTAPLPGGESPLVGQIQAGRIPGAAGSVSYEGPTTRGHARAQGMLGQIDQRVADYEQKDADRTNADLQAYQGAVNNEKAAVEGTLLPHYEYERRLNDIDTRRQALFEESARQEEVARQEAKASAAQFMGKYQEQLAAVRGMTVDIAGPLSKLNTGERFGLAFGLFAQGFLAAQGININVSGQVDKWVERSIAEQQRQIDQAEKGAQDTLNLWQISRQNSKDDEEARLRYRGYIIQGLQSQTELAAARFNSQLASAQAQVTAAHLGTEATLTAQTMARNHEQRVFEQKKWETQTAFELEKVNLEKMRVGLEAARAAAMANRGKQMTMDHPIIDPTTGRVGWVIPANRINATKDAEQATSAIENWGNLDKQIAQAMNYKTFANPDTYGKTGFFDNKKEAERVYTAMVNNIAVNISKSIFGKMASDKEGEKIAQMVPFDKWYQSGGNERVWDVLRNNLREQANQVLLQRAVAVPDRDNIEAPSRDLGPGVKAEHEARWNGKPPIQKFASHEGAEVVAKDSDDTVKGGPSRLWQHYTKDTIANQASSAGYNGERAANAQSDAIKNAAQPQWAAAIDGLAAGYAYPEHVKEFSGANGLFSVAEGETPDQISDESLKVLRQLATGKAADGTKVPKGAQTYADYVLSIGRTQLKDRLFHAPTFKASSEPGGNVSRRAPGVEVFGNAPALEDDDNE